MLRKFGILTLATGLLALLPGLARADKLDKKLNETAPEIVNYVKDKGYKNVGVLKFRAQRGNQPAGFSTGPINGNLAERLENLLVIHSGDDKGPMFGVIHDAGQAAQQQKVGSWSTSAAERNNLFEKTYPLAWGTSKVKADAFLTGKVATTGDLKKTTVTIQAFSKGSPTPVKVAEFTVDTDASMVRDMGYSFALTARQRSSLVKSRDAEGELVLEQANKQQPQPQPQPQPKTEDTKTDDPPPVVLKPQKPQVTASPDNLAGIEVKVKSGDDTVEIKQAGSEFQLECPAKGKPIAILLTNKTDKKLGVVLKVAGMSTIGQEKDESVLCRKWVIPAGKTYTVRGFYLAPDYAKYLPFTALDGDAAIKAKADLGDKAQFVQVDVFDNVEGDKEDKLISKASARGLPRVKDRSARATYPELRNELLKQAGLKKARSKDGESIIVPADEKDAVTTTPPKEDDFAKNPLQLGSLTVRVAPREVLLEETKKQQGEKDPPQKEQPDKGQPQKEQPAKD